MSLRKSNPVVRHDRNHYRWDTRKRDIWWRVCANVSAMLRSTTAFLDDHTHLQRAVGVKQDLAKPLYTSVEAVVRHGCIFETQLVGYHEAGLGAARDNEISKVSVVCLSGEKQSVP